MRPKKKSPIWHLYGLRLRETSDGVDEYEKVGATNPDATVGNERSQHAAGASLINSSRRLTPKWAVILDVEVTTGSNEGDMIEQKVEGIEAATRFISKPSPLMLAMLTRWSKARLKRRG